MSLEKNILNEWVKDPNFEKELLYNIYGLESLYFRITIDFSEAEKLYTNHIVDNFIMPELEKLYEKSNYVYPEALRIEKKYIKDIEPYYGSSIQTLLFFYVEDPVKYNIEPITEECYNFFFSILSPVDKIIFQNSYSEYIDWYNFDTSIKENKENEKNSNIIS